MSTEPPPVAPKAARITSIDALRGFVMFMMIFVNDLAGAPKKLCQTGWCISATGIKAAVG